MPKAFAHVLFVGVGKVFFSLVGQTLDDFMRILAGSAFLSPDGGSEGDTAREKFVVYDPPVFAQFGVGVVLDWVALGLVCLGRDANVNGDLAPVKYGVGDNVPGSESSTVAEGLLSGRSGVDGFGNGCDGTHDAVVSSGGLRCRATTCVRALGIEEFAASSGMRSLRVEIGNQVCGGWRPCRCLVVGLNLLSGQCDMSIGGGFWGCLSSLMRSMSYVAS